MKKMEYAQHPPMGWNSYDYYDTNVNEDQVKANADYMAAHLKKYGWEYIVVDIQWYAYGTASRREEFQYIPFTKLEMDEYARLLPCPEKFPSSRNGAGFKPLADYIHKLGLKFGIHIMRGIPRVAAQNHSRIYGSEDTADMVADPFSICGWNPDMYGVKNIEAGQIYYNSLIELYVSWGVDYIKCDDICNTNLYVRNPYSARHEIEMLHRAIERYRPSMVLSLSPGPALIEQAWHYEKNATMWRITDDFWDDWRLLRAMFQRCELWQNHVAPGSYPDCDMLPLGMVGKEFGHERMTNFTRDEQHTMMTLWCMFHSPLMLGAEMTKLDAWTLSLLTNKKVLSLLNEGYQGKQLERSETAAIWCTKKREIAEIYVALFNLSDQEIRMTVNLSECTALYGEKGVFDCTLEVEEIWTEERSWIENGELAREVRAHGVLLYWIKW